MPEGSDPYTYSGTDVLRNILDIRDPQQLAAFEANATAARLIELDERPLVGRFDVAHLKSIHQHIFQDVYRWAGEFRTVNISKGSHLFGVAAFIGPALKEVLRKLSEERDLKALDLRNFATRAGYYMGEIKRHPSFPGWKRPHAARVHPRTGGPGGPRNRLEQSHARTDDGGVPGKLQNGR